VEYECERKLDSAKSERVREKRWVDWEKSTAAANQAVTLYDDFGYIYRCVLGELALIITPATRRVGSCVLRTTYCF
jgi:hypothetical protein